MARGFSASFKGKRADERTKRAIVRERGEESGYKRGRGLDVGYCTIRCWRGGFSKLTRSKRESRFWDRWAHKPKRARISGEGGGEEEGERLVERGGGGSCFERFHSSMVPDYPSFCSLPYLSPRPPSPPPPLLLQPRRRPPRPPPPPPAPIGRDSRPRHTSASAKHFFIRSIFPPPPPPPRAAAAAATTTAATATDAPAAVALCMCSLACIRCESLD